jgi:hypothetical protein
MIFLPFARRFGPVLMLPDSGSETTCEGVRQGDFASSVRLHRAAALRFLKSFAARQFKRLLDQ